MKVGAACGPRAASCPPLPYREQYRTESVLQRPGKIKTDPNMSGGGLEMIHEKINNFGEKEICALAGGQIAHFRGSEVATINRRRLDGYNKGLI